MPSRMQRTILSCNPIWIDDFYISFGRSRKMYFGIFCKKILITELKVKIFGSNYFWFVSMKNSLVQNDPWHFFFRIIASHLYLFLFNYYYYIRMRIVECTHTQTFWPQNTPHRAAYIGREWEWKRLLFMAEN